MSSSASEGLLFFALVINGGLAGAIYALIALAFVLVYKASRMINFALGEWIMFGSLLASTGSNAIGGAVLFGCVGMALLGVAFNAIVLGLLVTRPVISVIMVTLGLGALMRGVAALCFRGVPSALTLPVSTDPVSFFGIDIAGAADSSVVVERALNDVGLLDLRMLVHRQSCTRLPFQKAGHLALHFVFVEHLD